MYVFLAEIKKSITFLRREIDWGIKYKEIVSLYTHNYIYIFYKVSINGT